MQKNVYPTRRDKEFNIVSEISFGKCALIPFFKHGHIESSINKKMIAIAALKDMKQQNTAYLSFAV